MCIVDNIRAELHKKVGMKQQRLSLLCVSLGTQRMDQNIDAVTYHTISPKKTANSVRTTEH